MIDWLASRTGRVHICGHRGHSIGAPENTLAALTAAAERGATTCEIDCHLSADGEIVLMHDQTLERTTDGSGLVDRHTLAELRDLDAGSWFAARFADERIPTLEETLRHAGALGIGIEIELKERRRRARMIERLGRVLADTGALDRVLVISFDHFDVLDARRAIPGVRTQAIIQARHADVVHVARAAQADSMSLEREMFAPDDAHALHAAGIAIRLHLPEPAWFAQHAALGLDYAREVRDWIAAGLVDSVSGDDVAFLSDLVAESGRAPAAAR